MRLADLGQQVGSETRLGHPLMCGLIEQRTGKTP